MRISDSERVLEDLLDGPPDVDDLVADAQEAFGVRGEMRGDAGAGGSVGLVDVDAVDGAAEVGCVAGGGGGGAPDGVVEDVDACCAGSVRCLC